jgi:threonine aldolase
MDLDAIRDAFRDPTDVHDPITSLVMLENTHSDSMAQPLTAGYTGQVAEVAHANGVPLHVDGARLFNAVVALGVPASTLLADVDSASFCLSKGLSCPVGSVVVGGSDFIWRARRARKLVGGGMRQVGVLAAPGLIALRDGPSGMIERLADDHANARRLAEGLAALPGVTGLDPARVRTNFVLFRVRAPEGTSASVWSARQLRARFLAGLEARGVRMVEYPDVQVRAVTHYGIERADIDAAIDAVRDVLRELGIAASAVPAVATTPTVATTPAALPTQPSAGLPTPASAARTSDP